MAKLEKTVAGKIRYVTKRDGVFQYIRRVPDSVINKADRFEALFKSQAVFRRSLRTKDQAAVYAAAQAVHDEFEENVAQALGRPTAVRAAPLPAPRTVTQSDLDDITNEYREAVVRPFKQAYLLADADARHADELQRLYDKLDMDAEEIRNADLPGAKSSEFGPEPIRETAAWVVQNRNLNAPKGSAELAYITAAIRTGKQLGYDYVDGIREGRIAPELPTRPTASKPAAGLTLRQAVEKYVEHKGFGKKPASEVTLSLSIFEGLIGNKAIAALTRSDFNQYVEHLSNHVVGGKSEGSIVRPVSAQTVKKRLGILCTVINFAIARDWFTGSNPASGIKIEAYVKKADKALMPDKRPFKTAELRALFSYPWFTGCKSVDETHVEGSVRLTGAEYWVPIVALYTGCRATELGGLRVGEVILDDDHPHIAIRANQYRGIKNAEARNVPILDALMNLGFDTYARRIKDSGSDRLFPDWDKGAGDSSGWGNSKLIRSFNRTVVPAALKSTLPSGARTEVTFHNLRSTFKTMLVSSEPSIHPNIINDVVGHAKGEMDSRYVGQLPIEVTYAAVHNCNYSGLSIPAL